MTPEDLAATLTARLGDDAAAEVAYGELTVTVPVGRWVEALAYARDDLGCTFFDWLTAVDELEEGFAVVVHVWSPEQHHHLLLRTLVTRAEPRLPSATGVFRGANWHERETYEMFGIVFDGHPHLVPLLLPDGFEGHPLRKEFVLAARAAKPWPGAKEPGESEHEGAPSRRKLLPPGVPDPATWGPRRPGEAPAAAAATGPPAGEPVRRGRRPEGAGAAGERPVRRPRGEQP